MNAFCLLRRQPVPGRRWVLFRGLYSRGSCKPFTRSLWSCSCSTFSGASSCSRSCPTFGSFTPIHPSSSSFSSYHFYPCRPSSSCPAAPFPFARSNASRLSHSFSSSSSPFFAPHSSSSLRTATATPLSSNSYFRSQTLSTVPMGTQPDEALELETNSIETDSVNTAKSNSNASVDSSTKVTASNSICASQEPALHRNTRTKPAAKSVGEVGKDGSFSANDSEFIEDQSVFSAGAKAPLSAREGELEGKNGDSSASWGGKDVSKVILSQFDNENNNNNSNNNQHCSWYNNDEEDEESDDDDDCRQYLGFPEYSEFDSFSPPAVRHRERPASRRREGDGDTERERSFRGNIARNAFPLVFNVEYDGGDDVSRRKNERGPRRTSERQGANPRFSDVGRDGARGVGRGRTKLRSGGSHWRKGYGPPHNAEKQTLAPEKTERKFDVGHGTTSQVETSSTGGEHTKRGLWGSADNANGSSHAHYRGAHRENFRRRSRREREKLQVWNLEGDLAAISLYPSKTKLAMEQENAELMEKAFAEMRERGVVPSVVQFNERLSLHGRRRDMEKVCEVLREMDRLKVERTPVVLNNLIHIFGRAGWMLEMERALSCLREKNHFLDNFACSSLLSIYSRTKQWQKAEEVEEEMAAQGRRLDIVSYTALFDFYQKRIKDIVKNGERVRSDDEAFDQSTFPRSRFRAHDALRGSETVFSMPITMKHARAGDPPTASEFNVEAEERKIPESSSISSSSSSPHSCTNSGTSTAFSISTTVADSSLPPREATLSKWLQKTENRLKEMLATQTRLSPKCCTTLITLYGVLGDIQKLEDVEQFYLQAHYYKVYSPDERFYQALVDTYFQCGAVERAEKLIEKMESMREPQGEDQDIQPQGQTQREGTKDRRSGLKRRRNEACHTSVQSEQRGSSGASCSYGFSTTNAVEGRFDASRVYASLIQGYSKCECLSQNEIQCKIQNTVERLLTKQVPLSSQSYSTIVNAVLSCGLNDQAWKISQRVLEEERKGGIRLDAAGVLATVKSCCGEKGTEQALSLYRELSQRVPTARDNARCHQFLLQQLMDQRDHERAEELYRSLYIEKGLSPPASVFRTFIQNYYAQGDLDSVLTKLREMQEEKVNVDASLGKFLVQEVLTESHSLERFPPANQSKLNAIVREIGNLYWRPGAVEDKA